MVSFPTKVCTSLVQPLVKILSYRGERNSKRYPPENPPLEDLGREGLRGRLAAGAAAWRWGGNGRKKSALPFCAEHLERSRYPGGAGDQRRPIGLGLGTGLGGRGKAVR